MPGGDGEGGGGNVGGAVGGGGVIHGAGNALLNNTSHIVGSAAGFRIQFGGVL
jgi:hypothetical protein